MCACEGVCGFCVCVCAWEGVCMCIYLSTTPLLSKYRIFSDMLLANDKHVSSDRVAKPHCVQQYPQHITAASCILTMRKEHSLSLSPFHLYPHSLSLSPDLSLSVSLKLIHSLSPSVSPSPSLYVSLLYPHSLSLFLSPCLFSSSFMLFPHSLPFLFLSYS